MKKHLITIITTLTTLLFLFNTAFTTALAATPHNTPANNQAMPTIAPMLKNAMPAVVNILAQGKTTLTTQPQAQPSKDKNENAQQSPNEDEFAQSHKRAFSSIGSGVIVDADKGYIITNAHVVQKANRITVTLDNGYRHRAKLIGSDPASDIALLQIKASALTAAKLANSTNLHVGDFVAAIGNPFGLKATVTSGIISALGRSGLGIEGYEDFIQTDASINPGNSGGALINMRGELIGINTAILAPSTAGTSGSIGIGFAIPSNMVKAVMAQLIKYGEVRRGLLGVYVQPLTPELASAFGINQNIHGAVINQLSPRSPAAQSGLRVGDVITAVNGTPVSTGSQVRNIIGLKRMGAKFKISLLRNGKAKSFTIHTENPDTYIKQTHQANPFLFGIAFENFEAQLPIQGHVKGIRVVALEQASPAWQAGVRPGDVIVSANWHRVGDIANLFKVANSAKKAIVGEPAEGARGIVLGD